MELTHQDVLQILELLEQSDVEYLELELGDTRLVASKHGEGPVVEGEAPRVRAPAAGSAAGTPAVTPAGTPAGADSMPDVGDTVAEVAPQPQASGLERATEQATAAEELVEVTAPMVGVFYRAPEPGAPPFVEAGSKVDEATTMGLIEVMKVFNSVSAGVAGEVVEILVDNEQFVDYGQALFRVRPERPD